MAIWLFLFGSAVGSFLNVVAFRYNPDAFVLNKKSIGGRSRCRACGHELRWFELIPIISYLVQFGRCRDCHTNISPQYPIVELLTGLIFVFVPKFFFVSNLLPTPYVLLSSILWILVFLTLLLLSLIDFRMNIIPDEANAFLVIAGIALVLLNAGNFGLIEGSFTGAYASIFGVRENIWLNHLFGALVGIMFFGLLVILTRGRGMGMGDVKLAGALGAVFGWPDIGLITALSFIIGSFVGIGAILLRKKGMKSTLPFGPFLAVGSLIVFFFGAELMESYFNLFRIVP